MHVREMCYPSQFFYFCSVLHLLCVVLTVDRCLMLVLRSMVAAGELSAGALLVVVVVVVLVVLVESDRVGGGARSRACDVCEVHCVLCMGDVWGRFSSAGWRISTPLEVMFYDSKMAARS